jgi:hypothetical protein
VLNHGKPFECAYGSNDDRDFLSSRSSFYSPTVAGFLPVGAVPGQAHDHQVSELDSDSCSDASSPFDRLVSHSARVRPLRILPTHAALPLLEFFFENILERFMFQT